MVQYIITPWRNRNELLNVRRIFYPAPDSEYPISVDEQRWAIALVSVWVQRGNCPHSIESTALLLSAILNEAVGNSAYAMRAAYSAAFCRFVTGLLDGYQDKRHKLSMYSIAKNIGLPATFVELRHQCTHEELPSLAKLRAAAERSLAWIWDHYWKNLDDSTSHAPVDKCRTFVREYLQWRADQERQDEDQVRDYIARLKMWDKEEVLKVLMEFMHMEAIEASLLLPAVKLSEAILSGKQDYVNFSLAENESGTDPRTRSLKDIRIHLAEAKKALGDRGEDSRSYRGNAEESSDLMQDDEDEGEDEDEDEDDGGWRMWKGLWVTKPIGVV